MTLTVTDLFCGAGGSSIGIEAAGAQTVNGYRLPDGKQELSLYDTDEVEVNA